MTTSRVPDDSSAPAAVTRAVDSAASPSISHYRIIERLGAGGMGVVYKAEDLRLRRLVAIKLLSPDIGTGDSPDAGARRQRFEQEARAASALDHPNVATIHEIDETADGQVFIVMACYEGESLKDRLARGPLGLDDAIALAGQIARGLAAAHTHGIVHRDIKPANVMVTPDGVAKIIDFGLAKLGDAAGLTQSGTTLGTVAYMAPEQARGGAVDARTDLWSLGVVLYEMLTGCLPFRAEQLGGVIRSILDDSPEPVDRHRPDVPTDLQAIVARALQKDPQRRYGSADEMLRDLDACRARLAGPIRGEPLMRRLVRTVRRPVVAVPVLLVLIALASWIYRFAEHQSRVRWAHNVAIPRVLDLASNQEYEAAFDLASEAERYLPGDPVLQQVWPEIAYERSIETTPPGADIYYRNPRAPDSPWKHVGRTNSGRLRFPMGVFQFDIRMAGFATVELAGTARGIRQPLLLAREGSGPADMALVPASDTFQPLLMVHYAASDSMRLGEFLIDKFEVTNRAYKAFVDGGGYSDPRYWTHAFVDRGKVIPWKEAIGRFQDRSGRPGPATWEFGQFPEGQDDYPVTGVSWYEAAAYAEFAGKSLPTLYHWAKAADLSTADNTLPLSNFGTGGLARAGSFRGSRNSLGLYDIAGNAREWCFNAAGENRFVLGAAWSDPPYFFVEPDERPAFDRSPETGFRCIKGMSPESIPEESLRAPARQAARDWSKERPMSDDEFRVWRALFSYEQAPLDARYEMEPTRTRHWTLEKVSFDLAGGRGRMVAYLFLPTASQPPYQAVVWSPGASVISQRTSDNGRNISGIPIFSHLIQDGRALLYPILDGTYERGGGQPPARIASFSAGEPDRLARQIREIRRCVDYLASRTDIDGDRLAYLGNSWGAFMGVPVLVAEPRFKAAILMAGGFRAYANVFAFAQRVKTPVQMVNGRYDSAFPLKISAEPMFRSLGTSDKRHVVLDCPHTCSPFLPEAQKLVRANLEWLDRYLGPVRRK
jgi:formylglycine-generating enzyme required for sulfatase activity/dienelactone hydrolase